MQEELSGIELYNFQQIVGLLEKLEPVMLRPGMEIFDNKIVIALNWSDLGTTSYLCQCSGRELLFVGHHCLEYKK